MNENQFSARQRKHFVNRLVAWFPTAMRPLPWRERYHPYEIWISEIMLQQTQAERGARYYCEWMRRFPDISSVAAASEEDILAAWEGLGYYSRARNVHNAAKHMMACHDGILPEAIADIRALPGVGDYTAGAIAAIAFNLPEPAVDANVLRIFTRLLDIDLPVNGKAVKTVVTAEVRRLLHLAQPRILCQALMELGALVCQKTPKCAGCPVSTLCQARQHGTERERPVKTARIEYTDLTMVAGIVMADDLVYIQKRPDTGPWAGMWEFPGGAINAGEDPGAALARHLTDQTGLAVDRAVPLPTVRHGYTTHRITLHGFMCVPARSCVPLSEPNGARRWVSREVVAAIAFPAGHRKLLEHLGWK